MEILSSLFNLLVQAALWFIGGLIVVALMPIIVILVLEPLDQLTCSHPNVRLAYFYTYPLVTQGYHRYWCPDCGQRFAKQPGVASNDSGITDQGTISNEIVALPSWM